MLRTPARYSRHVMAHCGQLRRRRRRGGVVGRKAARRQRGSANGDRGAALAHGRARYEPRRPQKCPNAARPPRWLARAEPRRSRGPKYQEFCAQPCLRRLASLSMNFQWPPAGADAKVGDLSRGGAFSIWFSVGLGAQRLALLLGRTPPCSPHVPCPHGHGYTARHAHALERPLAAYWGVGYAGALPAAAVHVAKRSARARQSRHPHA